MRRDTIILALQAVNVAAAWAVSTGVAGVHGVAAPWAAATLFSIALSLGAVRYVVRMRHLAAVTRQLRQSAREGAFSRLNRRRELGPLTDSVNSVIAWAEQIAVRARVAVKELEIQLKLAAAERDHAHAIIYSISDAVLVTDPAGELVLANESAARTFDFKLAELDRHQMPLDQLIHDPKLVELLRDMRQSNSVAGHRIVEHQVRTPAGEKAFKVTLSCVAGASGSNEAARPAGAGFGPECGNAGVVAVLHDVTREREIAEMKNDFVSSVSHELRTPLASIKAYVEMLVDGEAHEEHTRREFYDVIQNEANRLSRLIDNILNISCIESGLVRVNRSPQSLTVILKEAIEVIAPQARAKKQTITHRLTPIDVRVQADKDMLYQAVLNLLGNAVKYTPEGGGIAVDTVLDEARRKVIARVNDTGVGIPPKDLPFVFDKFYRAEANNYMAKGTGLGLSLVKHIVETVHKGRISVESSVGKGSSFGLELDLCD